MTPAARMGDRSLRGVKPVPHHLSVISYLRLQLLRRLGRAVAAVLGAVVTGVLALAAAAEGLVAVAGILLLATEDSPRTRATGFGSLAVVAWAEAPNGKFVTPLSC